MEAHHSYFFGGLLSSPVFSQQTFPVRLVALTTNGMPSFSRRGVTALEVH